MPKKPALEVLGTNKENCRMELENLCFPCGKPNSENGWVKLAEILPWD